MTNVSNVPEEVRAVAADGTKLRYALMELSNQYPDAIALGRGDPDLATPRNIIEAVERAIRNQQTGPTPVAGMPALREAVAEKLRRENGLPVTAENQRACLARGGAFARPAFWGAFRVIGDGAAAPELSPGFDPATWISIVILVAAGAAFVWNALRRRRFGG